MQSIYLATVRTALGCCQRGVSDSHSVATASQRASDPAAESRAISVMQSSRPEANLAEADRHADWLALVQIAYGAMANERQLRVRCTLDELRLLAKASAAPCSVRS